MSEMFYTILNKEKSLPYYVKGIGVNYVQGDIDRQETGHEDAQLFFTCSGEGTLVMDGVTYAMKSGSALFLPKGYKHEYHPLPNQKWVTYWVSFSGQGVNEMLDIINLQTAKFMEFLSIDRICRIMKRIIKTLKSDRIYGNYYASVYLYELFVEVNKQMHNIVSENDFNADNRMVLVIDYIEEHYHDKIKLQTLCVISDLSEQHLCRLFKKYLDTRPMEYLEKLRINEAKKKLMSTNKAVQIIAEDVGYENAAYFSKIFKSHEGMTPTEFRMTFNQKGIL